MFTLRLLGGVSLDGPDGPVAGRAALRQRIALLALLAVEHPRPVSRDKLVADLWPDSGPDEARHLLRDSLYILRSALGDDSVLAAGDDLRLNPHRLTCDLWDFEAALARQDPEAAVSAYHGPFLAGFHLSGGEEFERWVDGERSRLGRRYAQALEQLAERHVQAGELTEAVEWWSRLAREDPYNSRIALRYMQALEAAGDRAGALRHAAVHADLLRAELDAVPEREVVALAERLRLQSRGAPDGSAAPSRLPWDVSVSPVGGSLEHPSAASAPSRPARRGWALPAVVVVAVLGAVGVVGGGLSRERPPLNPKRVAVPIFANHTGRPDLDDLGVMAADWIVRGLMETPLVDVTDVEALYADGQHESERPIDPIVFARRNGAGMAIRGSYYRSGDSLLFQAGIVDVVSGRVLRALEPVASSLETPTAALEVLREDIAAGLSPVVNADYRGWPVDPELVVPPSFAAYREFVAGLREQTYGDPAAATEHLRRAAELDSSFVAPLVQLAWRATWSDNCGEADSLAAVIEDRTDKPTPWNRMTMDALRARCRGDMARAVDLLRERYRAFPQSTSGRTQYAWALQRSNQPRAAQAILLQMDPEHDAPWGESRREDWRRRYWLYLAASRHMLGEFRAELDITDRWRDSTSQEWWLVRGRALGALEREREAMELFSGTAGASEELVTTWQLTIATELWAHGQSRTAGAMAESVLSRVESGPDIVPEQARNIAWANRLLGRQERERAALEQIVRSDLDTLSKVEASARIAVLLADTLRADEMDALLAEESSRPLRDPWVRGAQILARARIAAGLGRRQQAVALLKEASARGMLDLGPSHAFHIDLQLAPLRGYPPFEALLRPDD